MIKNMEKDIHQIKVQIRAVPRIGIYDDVLDYTLEYRIEPSQLSWLKRTFFNEWKGIKACIYDSIFTKIISKYNIDNEFPMFKSKFKTLYDIQEYERMEYKRACKKKQELENEKRERNKIYY